MNMVGISAASPEGSYGREGEAKIEASLAALLMAGRSSVIFFTGRLLLPFWWSLLVSYGSAFGTQIWSTASRALWSDTWGIFILGVMVWMLVGVECKRYQLRPILLATLVLAIFCPADVLRSHYRYYDLHISLPPCGLYQLRIDWSGMVGRFHRFFGISLRPDAANLL
jgi:hypothetical protein